MPFRIAAIRLYRLFVPKDKETFLYEGISNQEEAEQTVRELNLDVQVVPVATLEEALVFLRAAQGSVVCYNVGKR